MGSREQATGLMVHSGTEKAGVHAVIDLNATVHAVAEVIDAKDAEIERLKAQLAASEEKRKVLAKFYKTGERYVESRYNQDDIHNAGYFSAQAAYAQAKLDIEAAKALEAP